MVLLSIFLLIGCQKNLKELQSDSKALSNITEEKITNQIKDEKIQKMSVFSQNDFDFIAGETVGKITVYTTAEKDIDGNFMWDDGQNFAVEVFDENQYFYLVPMQYVQLGTLQYKAFEDLNEENYCVIIEQITGAGITATEYRYHKAENAFIKRELYTYDNINNVVESIKRH